MGVCITHRSLAEALHPPQRLGICVHLFAVMVGPGNLFLYVHTCVCNILCRIVSAYRIYIYTHIYTYKCMYVYIYIYIHTHVYIYIYIYIIRISLYNIYIYIYIIVLLILVVYIIHRSLAEALHPLLPVAGARLI